MIHAAKAISNLCRTTKRGRAAWSPHWLAQRAVASSRTPTLNGTCAVNPSSARAALGSATMCRTSAGRAPPTTRGGGPAHAFDSSVAMSPAVCGVPEQTLTGTTAPGSVAVSTASALAMATSVTWTKSRRCVPSSSTVGASPRSKQDRNSDATPAYGVSRGILPGSHTADPQTLLALRINGEDLAPDHGYPCRIIAPNRPGVLQTKWVSRLEVR